MARRFNGLLDLLAPADNMGGLLSPQDATAAQRQGQMALAAGLLQAGGPQRMPMSFGQAIGQALPQARQYQSERQVDALRNQQMREQIVEQKKRKAAQEQLMGLLGNVEGPQGQVLGLLGTAAPELLMKGMIEQQFGQQQAARDPTDIQTMDALGIPRTPEGFAQLQGMKSDSGMKPMLDVLNLQIQGLNLANMQRTAEAEKEQARVTKLTRANSIERGLEQTQKIADLTMKLEGTALAAGLPASEWRRKGVGALSAVGGALGFDTDELNAEITAFDTFKKNLNDQLITLMSAGSLGQGTDSKLQQFRDSLASPDTAPGAVMAIQAGIAETLLDQAEVLDIEVPQREKIEASIERMRSYQPGGSDAVVDVPAAAAASGRVVTRAADIARMSLEQVRQIDPAEVANWTAEQRDALDKRLKALGF
jgi:hypothetical protein